MRLLSQSLGFLHLQAKEVTTRLSRHTASKSSLLWPVIAGYGSDLRSVGSWLDIFPHDTRMEESSWGVTTIGLLDDGFVRIREWHEWLETWLVPESCQIRNGTSVSVYNWGLADHFLLCQDNGKESLYLGSSNPLGFSLRASPTSFPFFSFTTASLVVHPRATTSSVW
jgi:hypothetical protein